MGAYRTVIVGTDGSETSFRAVDRAAEVARDAGATLVLVCAYFPNPRSEVDAVSDVLGDEAYQVVGSAPAESTLRQAAERAHAKGAKNTKLSAVEGKPVDVLIGSVREYAADLLVVGNLGLNTMTGRLLGSVPASVARGSSCDVLIVHTTP